MAECVALRCARRVFLSLATTTTTTGMRRTRVRWMGIRCREFFLKKISKSSDRRRDDRTATRRDATDGCDAYPRDGLGMVMIACVTDGVLLRRDAT